MRPLVLLALFATSVAAAEPSTVNGAVVPAPAKGNESLVAVYSAPQLGHLAVDGRLALGTRIQVELGGWNLFDDDRAGTFLRGGWLGVRGRLWQSDGVSIDVAGRALAGQEQGTNDAVAGLWAQTASRIRVLRWFSVLPDLELSWLGPLFQARFANEFRLFTGDWRLGGLGGAQLWVRDGLVTVAPMVEVTVGWRKHFAPFDLDASAGMALARDPSAILGHPVFRDVQGELGPWAFVRLAFVIN
ncbi:MAG: hypothetical protein AMXMBFR34_43060 [Myxococcaceae bacterium]